MFLQLMIVFLVYRTNLTHLYQSINFLPPPTTVEKGLYILCTTALVLVLINSLTCFLNQLSIVICILAFVLLQWFNFPLFQNLYMLMLFSYKSAFKCDKIEDQTTMCLFWIQKLFVQKFVKSSLCQYYSCCDLFVLMRNYNQISWYFCLIIK